MTTFTLLDAFRTGLFARSVAATTLTFFAWTFCISQPAYAVQQELGKQEKMEAAFDAMMEKTPEAKLAHRLQKLKDAVTGVELPAQTSGWTAALNAVGLGPMPVDGETMAVITALAASIEEAKQGGLVGFDADLAAIKQNKRLSPAAKQQAIERHAAAKGTVLKNLNALQRKLTSLQNAKRPKAQRAIFEDLKQFLAQQQFKKGHTPVDPHNLPFGTPKPEQRAPLEDAMALYSLTHDSVQLAANTITPEMLAGAFGEQGGIEADLAETIDTTQTQAIKDLATQLNNDPIQIYTWVANNIRFVPSYGSIQGADITLQTKRGNAMDTASLLISILRAAGIPARYAYGTVQMPIDKAMNWVGGVEVPESALNLMQQGGIPSILVKTNGVISHIKFEHTWVEAWVDFEPSRGMKNIEGDNFMPLDASYKQYEFIAPTVDLQTAVPFDAQALANIIQQGSTINEQEGWVQNVPQQAIQDSLTNYQTQLQTYLETQQPDATVGDVLGIQQTKILPARPLASGLPYHLITKNSHFSEVADSQRLKFKYELYTNNYGTEGTQLLKIEEPTVKLAGQKLALSFKPATQADEDLIASYIPEPDPTTGEIDPNQLPQSLPGYLIHLVPEFTIGNEIKATSTTQQTMGQELISVMGYQFPGKGYETTQNLPIAGQYEAIALDLQGISPDQANQLKTDLETTKARLEAEDLTSITKHEVVGDLLYATILSWFALNNVQSEISSRQASVIDYRAPSYGLFQTSLQTQYYWGLPKNVKADGLMMDADRSSSQMVDKQNKPEAYRNYMRTSGVRQSAMEHLVPEHMFSSEQDPAPGVSAVKAIQLAAAQGQRIYAITQTNVDVVLSSITLPVEVETTIRNVVAAGKEVTTHEMLIDFYGSPQLGYTVIDPQTGAGGYHIFGGEDGLKQLINDAGTALTYTSLVLTLVGFFALFIGGPFLAAVGLLSVVVALVSMVQTYAAAFYNCTDAAFFIIGILALIVCLWSLLILHLFVLSFAALIVGANIGYWSSLFFGEIISDGCI